jgi:uncharacterized damage-inducible protein DinB
MPPTARTRNKDDGHATAHLLANYNAWADSVLFAAVAKLPANDIYRQTTTLFGSIVGTLNHNYQVDLIWQAHLLGKEHTFSTRRDILHPKFENLVQAQMVVNDWLIEWTTHQTTTTLSETVAFRFVSGQDAKMQKGTMLLHVINHKTYHRGWVSQMFFDVGAKPPETDLSVYMSKV